VKDLDDYSGEIIDGLKLEDFSRDALEKLVIAYTKLYMILDTYWYKTVWDRQDYKEAWASEIQTWGAMSRFEMKSLAKIMNIQGNGLHALIKTMQMTPWFHHTGYEIEVENENSIVLTITDCITLTALEKEGQGREKDVCSILGPKLFEDYASVFNPNIKVTCLTQLPRGYLDDIPCKWKFTLTEESGISEETELDGPKNLNSPTIPIVEL